MDERIVAALRSKDADLRRKGIIAAGKSGDVIYLKALNNLIYTDDVGDLRELAQKAAQHIRAKEVASTTVASTTGDVNTVPTLNTAPRRPAAPAPAAPPVQRRPSRYSARKMIPFLLFILVVAGAGAYFVWARYGDVFRHQQLIADTVARLEAAVEFPRDGSTAAPVLDGNLYQLSVSSTATFFIQEPEAQMPDGGWPIVMCVGGGTPRASGCFTSISERAARENVLFVSPNFYSAVPGGLGWHDGTGIVDVRIFLDELDAYYAINWKRSVIYGFSYGGYFASYYAASYPLDFAGVVMGDPAGSYLPPDNSPVRYGLISGDAMGYERELYGFVDSMEQRGTPVWRSRILPGIGHIMTPQHVNMIFDLLAELSASP